MTKEKGIPQIRFSGFTDTWEQRKLSAIADKVTEKNVGLQYIETFTNSAEFGIISQRDFFDHDIAKMSSLGGYYIVRSEDFVYNPRISTSAPVGPINRNKLGRIGVMSPLYTVFRPHDIDTTYLEYFFKSKYWHSFMNFNGDSGARSDRFSIKDSVFFEMPIPIPHIDEQKKIGEYLAYLDRLITLHQRKYDKLTKVKKAMLEKMFPENGSPYPEIRFKGFTDAWEQRKLIDEVASIDTGKSKFTPQESGQYEILGSTSVIGYDDTYDYEGDFLLTARVGANAGELYRYSGKVKISDNTVFIKGEQLDFVYYALLHFDIKRLSFGTGQPLVKASELKVQEIMMPVEDTERTVIGEYFANLDRLITLHQRKLEKLKNIKKACLEKMFV